MTIDIVLDTTVFPVNENGEIVVQSGTGSNNIQGFIPNNRVPTNKATGKVSMKFPDDIVNWYSQSQKSLARSPSVTDNASLGYSSGSIWQANKQLYQPIAAPDNTAAVWGTLQDAGSASFCDVMGASNVVFSGGLVNTKYGYLGQAIDISVAIAGTPTTFSIGFLANGEFNVALLQSYISQADAGTLVTCTKLYDHSGAGNHYVKNASYPAPYVDYDSLLGRYCLMFDGKTTTPRCLQAPSGVISGTTLSSGYGVSGNAVTVYATGRGTTTATSSGQACLFSLGDMQNATAIDRRYLSTFASIFGGYGAIKTNNTVDTVPVTLLDSQPNVMLYVNSTTNATMSINEDIGTVGVSNDTAVYSGGYLGTFDPLSSSYCSHRLITFSVAKVAATTAQQAALRNGAYTKYDIRPQVKDQVFIIGDSRTSSAFPLASKFDSISMEIANRVPRSVRVYGMGLSGLTAADMSTYTIPRAVAMYNPKARNTAIYLAGVNDIIVDSVSPATALSRIKAGVATLKAAGYYVVLMNELATTFTGGGNPATQLPILRALITAQGIDGMGCDAIVDLLQYAPMQTPSNAIYYADGLHPTPAVDALWASTLTKYLVQ